MAWLFFTIWIGSNIFHNMWGCSCLNFILFYHQIHLSSSSSFILLKCEGKQKGILWYIVMFRKVRRMKGPCLLLILLVWACVYLVDAQSTTTRSTPTTTPSTSCKYFYSHFSHLFGSADIILQYICLNVWRGEHIQVFLNSNGSIFYGGKTNKEKLIMQNFVILILKY